MTIVWTVLACLVGVLLVAAVGVPVVAVTVGVCAVAAIVVDLGRVIR